MKLLQMRELKNLRSASTGDDEMQLRNAIKEARRNIRKTEQNGAHVGSAWREFADYEIHRKSKRLIFAPSSRPSP